MATYDDPWGTYSADVARDRTVQDGPPPFAVETLTEVYPLDAQQGVMNKLFVPDALREVLFRDTPGVQTFAILDAAKIEGLPELLETSGLPHVCLFEQADDLDAVAPWLVQLEPQAPLTRNLFTRGPAPWLMWEADGGIILRSTASLAALRGHLRRFTKVQIDGRAPVFFRFWEPRVMARYLAGHHTQARDHVLALLNGGEMICVDRHNDWAIWAKATEAAAPPRPSGPWPHLHDDLAVYRLQIFCEDLADRLARDIPPLADVARAERREMVTLMVDAARRTGLRVDKSVERYCIACILLGQLPETKPEIAKLLDSPQHELDRSRKMLKLVRKIKGNT